MLAPNAKAIAAGTAAGGLALAGGDPVGGVLAALLALALPPQIAFPLGQILGPILSALLVAIPTWLVPNKPAARTP